MAGAMGQSWGSGIFRKDSSEPSPKRSKSDHGGADAGKAKQFTVPEAVAILEALRDAFKKDSFQKPRRHIEAAHPRRSQRDHGDGPAFMKLLQAQLERVYSVVLPRPPWTLDPGWAGFQQMESRMRSVSQEPRVVQLLEEINTLLGFPKQFVIRAPPEEPVVVEMPDGSGSVPQEVLLTDEDGDRAHEFWKEGTDGQLRIVSVPTVYPE